MDLDRLAATLTDIVGNLPNPSQGLSDPIFNFILKVTPMINVDLLVRDEMGRHLLAWRVDAWGEGWHIPGSIIRFNELIHDRIAACAQVEIGATVEADLFPSDIKQLFTNRGHFVSLLYRCKLTSEPDGSVPMWAGEPLENGMLAWVDDVPDDLYPAHHAYAEWLRQP